MNIKQRKKYNRLYYQRNKEKINQKRRKYYQENKDKVDLQNLQYYEKWKGKNKDYQKRYGKAYRQKPGPKLKILHQKLEKIRSGKQTADKNFMSNHKCSQCSNKAVGIIGKKYFCMDHYYPRERITCVICGERIFRRDSLGTRRRKRKRGSFGAKTCSKRCAKIYRQRVEEEKQNG
jgi:hypothetical protein